MCFCRILSFVCVLVCDSVLVCLFCVLVCCVGMRSVFELLWSIMN